MVREIKLFPFKFKHLSLLHDMLSSQKYLNISDISMKTLPKIGYIAMLGNTPVAAGFLRRVEGGYAQMDGLCSNAYLGSIVRHEGVSKVVLSLIEDSNRLGLHGIIAFTKDQGVLKRAESLGFKTLSETLIVLPRS